MNDPDSIDDLGLIPYPRTLERQPGRCRLSRVPAIRAAPELGAVADRLAASFRDLRLKDGPGASLKVDYEPDLPDEAYTLSIDPEEIVLRAATEAGVGWGFQTIRALALGRGSEIPCLRIGDAPTFGWRGCMLDTSRNYFPVPWLLSFLDAMALLKLNRFHWHLTDDQAWRMALPSMPGLAERASTRLNRLILPPEPEGGHYSAADMAKVVSYAAERGILVMPELEMPGHVTALLSARPDLACTSGPFEPGIEYGIYEDVLCTGNESLLPFVGALLDDVVSIFPSPLVHLGGDEVRPGRWDACPRCAAFREREGIPDARAQQSRFTRDLDGLARARGRRLAAWDEVLEGDPPADAVIFSWRGTEAGVEAARRGHDVVMCPEPKGCYLNFKHRADDCEPGRLGVATVRESFEFDPLAGFGPGEESAKARILGLQGNLWTEELRYGRWVEYQAFPRLSALAETGWAGSGKRDFGSFATRLGGHTAALRALGMHPYEGPLE